MHKTFNKGNRAISGRPRTLFPLNTRSALTQKYRRWSIYHRVEYLSLSTSSRATAATPTTVGTADLARRALGSSTYQRP